MPLLRSVLPPALLRLLRQLWRALLVRGPGAHQIVWFMIKVWRCEEVAETILSNMKWSETLKVVKFQRKGLCELIVV